MELSRPISPGTSRRISSALVIFVAISAIRARHRGRVVVFAVMSSSVSHAACARSQARKRGPPPPHGFPRRASRKRARDASSPSARRYREHQRSPSRSARARRVSGPRFLAEQATAVRGSIAAVPALNTLLPCTPQSPKDFCIVDTGPLTATQAVQGGANEASLVCYPSGTNCFIQSPLGDPTNGAVAARVLHAEVVAAGNKSRAEASVADLALNIGGVGVS